MNKHYILLGSICSFSRYKVSYKQYRSSKLCMLSILRDKPYRLVKLNNILSHRQSRYLLGYRPNTIWGNKGY